MFAESNGIPFRTTISWLDGRTIVELAEVQANAAGDSSKFAKPSAPKPQVPSDCGPSRQIVDEKEVSMPRTTSSPVCRADRSPVAGKASLAAVAALFLAAIAPAMAQLVPPLGP